MQQAGDAKLSLTDDKVLIESLRSQIKSLETRVAVTDDLVSELARLKSQLAQATKSN